MTWITFEVYIEERFSDEELRRLCYDLPEFRSVYDTLQSGVSKDHLITRLINYSRRNGHLETLRTLVEKDNFSEENITLKNKIRTLSTLGQTSAAQGDFSKAVDYYQQALEIARRLADPQVEAISWQNIGLAWLNLANGEPDKQQSHLSRAVEAFRQAAPLFDLDDPSLQRTNTEYYLGHSYYRLGRWREAIALFEQVRQKFAQNWLTRC